MAMLMDARRAQMMELQSDTSSVYPKAGLMVMKKVPMRGIH